jgi:hypothetical protein
VGDSTARSSHRTISRPAMKKLSTVMCPQVGYPDEMPDIAWYRVSGVYCLRTSTDDPVVEAAE